MEDQSYFKEFHLLSFSANSDYTSLTTCMIFILYMFGVLINAVIISMIYIDDQLHTPMYLFLCNLALVDICHTTTIVPKPLYMLLSGDNTVSFIQYFTQMYFYFLASFTKDILIFVMAYDQYVPVYNPLYYHNTLNSRNCLLLASGTWISGCLKSALITVPVLPMSFCHSNILHDFVCHTKALIHVSCAGSKIVYFIICLELLVYGFLMVVFSLLSYLKIIRVILQIKSKNGRRKAFSTCSSHLITLIIYFMTGLSAYTMPPTEYSNVLEQVFTALYSFVTPMINPLIYSLRNKDVKSSFHRILGVKPIIKK